MSQKEKRFFNNKKEQLTSVRKGKNQLFVLSPEQIKFNQGNLKQRLDNEEKIQLEYQSTRRAHSNNPPTKLEHMSNNNLPVKALQIDM